MVAMAAASILTMQCSRQWAIMRQVWSHTRPGRSVRRASRWQKKSNSHSAVADILLVVVAAV